MGKKLIISNLGQETTNTATTSLSLGKVGIVVAGTDVTTITPSKSALIHIMANYAADRKDITPTFTLFVARIASITLIVPITFV